jgi:uncharacterized repeat protein (TIGR03806 family)
MKEDLRDAILIWRAAVVALLMLMLPLAQVQGDVSATRPAIPLTSPAQYECRFTEEAITIDGKADEPAWKTARVIDQFRIPGKEGGAATPRTWTHARLLWDRQYLYYFAEMQDVDLYADVTEHNGKLWDNDVFELFFKPAEDKPAYYEFQVNAANATLELFLPSRGAGGYQRFRDQYPFEMKTAVKLRGTLNHWQDVDEGWSVEGRIRWQDLMPTGGRPNADDVWKFALCRFDYSTGLEAPELSSSAPLTEASFHRYEDYSSLKFVGPSRQTAGSGESGSRWTNSRVVGSPDPAPPYRPVRAFEKLKVFQPIYVAPEPGTENLLLIQHLGSWAGPSKISRFKNDPSASELQPLLELDYLVYGLTFHPDFANNRYVYLFSNGPVNASVKRDRVSRFTMARSGPSGFEPGSEKVILEWDSDGHNGGDLAFGPDGYLYFAAGDGTADSDKNLRGQNIGELTSAMIRIDVDHPSGGRSYSIPKDNPFVDHPGARPEIWAYGFRNPWRLSFDAQTGGLWVGQNGQDLWEQAYLVRRGENYGWSVYEGSHPFNLSRQRGPTPIVPPAIEHPHSQFRSLTGGVVYYGDKLPDLRGMYVYGDWSTGQIWGARHDGTRVTWNQRLADTTLQIVCFRVDQHGDLLVVDHGGAIYKLEASPAAPSTQPAFPRKLSETGLFKSVKDHVPDQSLIPYSVNSPLWSDGAAKERFIALPGDSKIEMTPSRGWNFEDGAVLVKTFSLDMREGDASSRRRIETRLLTRQSGQWHGYTYLWNDGQSDADLVGADGVDKDYLIRETGGGQHRQTWHYPSRTECMVCHSRAANWVLGLTTLQMNKVHDYGAFAENQLRVLERRGVLKVDYLSAARSSLKTEALGRGMSDEKADKWLEELASARTARPPKSSSLLIEPPENLPRLPDPYDASLDLTTRARSYLHANCAQCHIKEGGGNALIDLEFTTSATNMRALDALPVHETFGLPDPRLIAPGHPERSVLLYRLAHRGTGQMPPLATSVPDERAVKLMTEWIAQMK